MSTGLFICLVLGWGVLWNLLGNYLENPASQHWLFFYVADWILYAAGLVMLVITKRQLNKEDE